MSNTFEHVLCFPDEATAQADPIVGRWWRPGTEGDPGSWDMSVCIPGLKCRDVRNDMMNEDGSVTMTFLPGWWLNIGLAWIEPALRDHPDLRLLADHDAREVQHANHTVWCLKAAVPMDDVPFYMINP
jgi:hypothetical protein